MKKRFLCGLLVAVLAIFACACKGKDKEETTEDGNSVSDFFGNEHYTDVDYYGCPNSKRIKKLNLKKKRAGI